MVNDLRGVILDVEVTTGEVNQGQVVVERIDATMATTGRPVTTVTADAGYAYAKVYGALERRGIDPLIPTKAEPIRSAVPLRRFRYDARNDIVKCPPGRILRPVRPIKHGRFAAALVAILLRLWLGGTRVLGTAGGGRRITLAVA